MIGDPDGRFVLSGVLQDMHAIAFRGEGSSWSVSGRAPGLLCAGLSRPNYDIFRPALSESFMR